MIRLERRGHLRIITLARSERRNALTPQMVDRLLALVTASQGECRGLVLLGEGPTFCAGFDLALCAADAEGRTMRRLLSGLSGVVRAMRALPAPVVVGVQGGAIAGGCALLAGADLVVADRGARLGYPVVRIGVSPAVSASTLAGAVGTGPTRRLQLDPGLIDAAEAARLGLVHEIVSDPGDVPKRALELAEGLAGKPPEAMAATKAWCLDVEAALASATGAGSPGDARHDAALAASLGLVGGPEEARLLPLALAKGAGPGSGCPGGGDSGGS
ncbi:MAG: enoyl-CoA hydratase/isomerase family protein [Phycisphaeraceae bacterium]|nr:enoyl-CoA hydratase/isomerase family protein [Phycisphaeraceae bacterium]